MKIIITASFGGEYNKSLKKYFQLELFSQKLIEKSHTFIDLHDPFLKCKLNLNRVDFRGVVVSLPGEKIVPLFLVLKKDKKLGENISWKTQQNTIQASFLGALEDIRLGKYEVYE